MSLSRGTASADNSSSPSNSDFGRKTTEFTAFTLPTSSANLVMFDLRGFSGGTVYVSDSCTLTWYSQPDSHNKAGTAPTAAVDSEGTAIPQTVMAAAGECEIPPALFGRAWIGMVSDQARTGTIVTLKT